MTIGSDSPRRELHSRRASYRFCVAILLSVLAGALANSEVHGYQASNAPSVIRSNPGALANQTVALELKPSLTTNANIIRLGDLVSNLSKVASSKSLSELPISPSPLPGQSQTWTRKEIEDALRLRGVTPESIRWSGSGVCFVERTNFTAPAASSQFVAVKKQMLTSTADNPLRHTGVLPENAPIEPDALQLSKSESAPKQGDASSEPSSVLASATTTHEPTPALASQAGFTAAFVSPGTVTQASHVVSSAIENYLQTKTDSNAAFEVSATIPPDLARTLVQRRLIAGVSGGDPPYDGQQTFKLLVQSGKETREVEIEALVKLPEIVLVAKRQLPKGHLLQTDDMTYLALPKGFKGSLEDCFSRLEDVVGKELKRSMSTHQVIQRSQIGQPVLIRAGDLIKIEVVLGGIVIETSGRALENGGMDDLVHVETADHKKRLVARVRSDRLVEVYSIGNANSTSRASNTSALRNVPR